MYGPVPAELAFFADTGVAWSGDETPRLFGGSRAGISSAGAALRLSLGLAVAEINFTRPFQSAERWVFGFNLLPGW
jgi:outer membrane protein assembly factor BamA